MFQEKEKLQLSSNTSNWRRMFMKRTARLKTMMRELATLCDVPALLIYFDSEGKVDTWPEEPDSVSDIIHRFQELHMIARKNKLNQTSYLAGMIGKLEEQLRRLIEDDISLPFFTWDQRLDCFPFEALMQLIASLEFKKMLVHERIQSLLQNPNPDPNVNYGGLLQSLQQNPNPNCMAICDRTDEGLSNAGIAMGNQRPEGLGYATDGLFQSLLPNPNPNPNPNMAMGNHDDEGLSFANGDMLQSLLQNPKLNMAMDNQVDEGLSYANGGQLHSLLQNPKLNMAMGNHDDEGLSFANGDMLQSLLQNPNLNMAMDNQVDEGLSYANGGQLHSPLQNPNLNMAMGNQVDEGLNYANGGQLHSLLQNSNMAMGSQPGGGLSCADGDLLQFPQQNPNSNPNYMATCDEGWNYGNGRLMDQVQPLLHETSSQGQNLDDLDHNVSLSSYTMQEIIHQDFRNCSNASVDDYFTFMPPLMPFKRLEFDASGSPSSSYLFDGDL